MTHDELVTPPLSEVAPEPLAVAVRVHTVPTTLKRRRNRGTTQGPPLPAPWPELVLLFDTETTVDEVQRLRVGAYRVCRWIPEEHGRWALQCLEEGLFYGDDLLRREREAEAVLMRYRGRYAAAVTSEDDSRVLELSSRREFVKQVFWKIAYEGRALVVAFNLPFDLSRLAVNWAEARARGTDRLYAGGFSFQLGERWDTKASRWVDHDWRPHVLIKHIDSKRAFIQFSACYAGEDNQPARGGKKRGRPFRGRFIDLRTFAFALTGEGYALESACEAFGVDDPKEEVDLGGPITPELITYCRHDVRRLQNLLVALRAELEQNPIGLAPWELHSPASLAKGYLRAMGDTPLARRVDR